MSEEAGSRWGLGRTRLFFLFSPIFIFVTAGLLPASRILICLYDTFVTQQSRWRTGIFDMSRRIERGLVYGMSGRLPERMEMDMWFLKEARRW